MLVIREDDVGNAGSEKGKGVPLDRKESGEVHGSTGTTESRSDVTTSQRLKRWHGKSDKHAMKEARLFQRGRQWEKASPMGSSNVR